MMKSTEVFVVMNSGFALTAKAVNSPRHRVVECKHHVAPAGLRRMQRVMRPTYLENLNRSYTAEG